MKNIIITLNHRIQIYQPQINGLYIPIFIDILNCLVYDHPNDQIISAIIKPAITPIYLYNGSDYMSLNSLPTSVLSSRILERFGVLIEDKLNDLISMNPGYRRV